MLSKSKACPDFRFFIALIALGPRTSFMKFTFVYLLSALACCFRFRKSGLPGFPWWAMITIFAFCFLRYEIVLLACSILSDEIIFLFFMSEFRSDLSRTVLFFNLKFFRVFMEL